MDDTTGQQADTRQRATLHRGTIIRATATLGAGKVWTVDLDFFKGDERVPVHRIERAFMGENADHAIDNAFGRAALEIDTNPARFGL